MRLDARLERGGARHAPLGLGGAGGLSLPRRDLREPRRLQRAGQRPRLVGAVEAGDGPGKLPGREGIGGAGQRLERREHAAAQDDDGRGAEQRHHGEGADQKGQLQQLGRLMGHPLQLGRPVLRGRGRRDEPRVELLAVGPVRIVVAETVGGRSSLRQPKAQQLPPEAGELAGRLAQGGEVRAALGRDERRPAGEVGLQRVQGAGQPLAEAAHLRLVLRQVDAAAFHHHAEHVPVGTVREARGLRGGTPVGHPGLLHLEGKEARAGRAQRSGAKQRDDQVQAGRGGTAEQRGHQGRILGR
jgi:hypothetical protein